MERIVLFDGACNFCDAGVQFIIKHDPERLFHFASLQSEVGQRLLDKYGVPVDSDSMVLIEKDKAYDKSTAALRISRHLQGAWQWLYVFIIIPSPIRNVVYDLIAKNRYKWFGKKESCRSLPPSEQKRFLS